MALEAERALEVQELEMTWRYSVGNIYEELSYAEALDVAQVMAGYGYRDVARQILRYTLAASRAFHVLARRRASRRRGPVLPADGNTALCGRGAPALRSVVSRLERELVESQRPAAARALLLRHRGQ